MAIGREPDVVVDQEHGIPCRSIEPVVALDRESTGSRVVIGEAQPGIGTDALDVRARRGLVARIDDAELLGQHGLGREALDRLDELRRGDSASR